MQNKNKTVVKSMDILNLFKDHSKLSLNEIVQLSGIPKTSVHRMIGSLEDMGFLKKDIDNKYSLGLLFMEFGQLVKERLDIRKIALPTMHSLRDEANEAVNLVIKEGNEAIYIEKLETKQPVRVYTKIGRKAPLYGGACPRAILAFLPQMEIEQYLSEIELIKVASGTITDKEELLHVLAACRKNGYTVSHSELQDYSSAVAAPIFDSANQVVASISLVGPSVRFQEEHLSELIRMIKKGADEISYRLGWK